MTVFPFLDELAGSSKEASYLDFALLNQVEIMMKKRAK